MNKLRFNYGKLAALCAVLAMILLQSVAHPKAAESPSFSSVSTDADLSSEGRILDNFLDALSAFDKKHAELSKKAILTRVEFDSHQRTANDLKGRLSGVQNALQDVIRKLKAAGQWDNLDALVLAKISDSRFQAFARREGFKKILEAASTGLSADANEISNPLDILRNKVKAQAQDEHFAPGNSPLTLRPIPVAYTPAPAVFALNVRCRVAWLRLGLSYAVSGTASERAENKGQCYCQGNQAACDAL